MIDSIDYKHKTIPDHCVWLKNCLFVNKPIEEKDDYDIFYTMIDNVPIRCLQGHVIGTVYNLETFTKMTRSNHSLKEIFEFLKINEDKRQCCRNILMGGNF